MNGLDLDQKKYNKSQKDIYTKEGLGEMKSQYCDVTKVGSEILKAIGNENTWDIIDKENKDFKRGAMWGMAWVMNHVYAYTPKINAVEQYPCNHCGECPIWLAALS